MNRYSNIFVYFGMPGHTTAEIICRTEYKLIQYISFSTKLDKLLGNSKKLLFLNVFIKCLDPILKFQFVVFKFLARCAIQGRTLNIYCHYII